MKTFKVFTIVNSPKNDVIKCMEPLKSYETLLKIKKI